MEEVAELVYVPVEGTISDIYKSNICVPFRDRCCFFFILKKSKTLFNSELKKNNISYIIKQKNGERKSVKY